jgi:hypothetical protein
MTQNKTKTEAAPMVFEIKDQDFIRKAHMLAARKGRKDVDQFMAELLVKVARRAVGLEKDLNVEEVAEQLECHRNTVRNYYNAGKFPNAYHRTPRLLLVPQKDVDALKKSIATATSHLATGAKVPRINVKYPIKDMTVGDSFIAPFEKRYSIRSLLSAEKSDFPQKQFVTRELNRGRLAVYRTA